MTLWIYRVADDPTTLGLVEAETFEQAQALVRARLDEQEYYNVTDVVFNEVLKRLPWHPPASVLDVENNVTVRMPTSPLVPDETA